MIFWLLATVGARRLVPSWESLAYDGDFDSLPAEMASVQGVRLRDAAFPDQGDRSQLLLVVARRSEEGVAGTNVPETSSDGLAPLTKDDEYLALDLVRRLHHKMAEVSLQRAVQAGWSGAGEPRSSKQKRWLEQALFSLDEALRADEAYGNYFEDVFGEVTGPEGEVNEYWPRMAIAFWDRAFLRRQRGDLTGADADQATALSLVPEIAAIVPPLQQRESKGWESLLEVRTWYDKDLGMLLAPRSIRLGMLRLSSEYAAVSNIRTLEVVEEMIGEVERRNRSFTEPGLQILPTGTAALGAETLRSSASAIRYTEVLTVVLVLVILTLIYRSPLLIAIPVISIAVAVVCATGMVALLVALGQQLSLDWLELKIFTTTRIFVIVILFGAGTDYCLFLIARLREETRQSPWREGVSRSLAKVSDALLGSALTTVVGLAMLWFAHFGKFQHSGPVIAVCLLVALAVCMTLTPALLIAIGPAVLWPSRSTSVRDAMPSLAWERIAKWTTHRPGFMLTGGLLLLFPLALYGVVQEGGVTYDLASELSPSSQSRQGMEAIRQSVPLGQINPITMLVVRPDEVPREQFEKELPELAWALYEVTGISSIRHAEDPLGDSRPETEVGLFRRETFLRRVATGHPLVQKHFWSTSPTYANRLIRLDLVTANDPFALQSTIDLAAIDARMRALTESPASPWFRSTFAFEGAIPAVADLRLVTLEDAKRIKIAVVLAVLVILLLVLRRTLLSLYMIFTVLVTYFATLGLTVLFFRGVYGETYVGLDWKVPIFLFVILVAVGQDYNVYLVTRILEEQRSSHPLVAISRAVARTGGIITSCGVVMAATFLSMTASSWVPPLAGWFGIAADAPVGTLRGITELGFALGLGILLDTFYVRTVLVPSFCALQVSRSQRNAGDRGPIVESGG